MVGLYEAYQWTLDFLFIRKLEGRWSDRWIFLRSTLAIWLCAVAMVLNPLERAAGPAAFLPLIFAYVKFPSDPTVVFIFHSLLGALGTLVTWAYCVLMMKVARLARDHDQDLRTLAQLNATIYEQYTNPSPELVEEIFVKNVFRGKFLQTSSSLIYAAFFFVGVYFIMLVRAMNIRLFHIMVFAIILLAIFGTYGPLFPTWYALELGKIYVIPFGYYLAVCFFVSIFIAPQSVASLSMERLHTVTSLLGKNLSVTPAKLRELNDDEVDGAITAWDGGRAGILTTFQLMLATSGYMCKELSIGKASGKDVERLSEKIRMLSALLAGQSIFIKHVRYRNSNITKEMTSESRTIGGGPSMTSLPSLPYASAPALQDLLISLAYTTSRRQDAIVNALRALDKFFDRNVHWRYGFYGLLIKQPAAELAELTSALEELRAATAQAYEHEKLHQITSLKNMKLAVSKKTTPDDNNSGDDDDAEALEKCPSYLREVFKTFLTVFSSDLETILELAMKIEQKPVRLWLPGNQNQADYPDHRPVPVALMTQFARAMGGQTVAPLEEDNPDVIDGVRSHTRSDEEEASYREPISRKIYRAYNWFTSSPESVFSLKCAVLGIATACPAWISDNSTTEVYYRHRGLWALITAVTSKGMFSGETTHGFIQRIVGVVIGATAGLVTWYISAGSGGGNAYGLAATSGVVLLLTMPWRIWNPNVLVTITATTTGALVVGYSWIGRPDATVHTTWPPGQGYIVYWIRIVVVGLGVIAAWLIDLFPRPVPGRETIRRTYSVTVLQLGNLTADLVSGLRKSHKDHDVLTDFVRISVELRAIHTKLRLSSVRIELAKLEPSLRRAWSPERYISLQKLQFHVIDLLGLLAFLSEKMDDETRTRLFSTHVFQTTQIAALLNVFNAVSYSLASERPVPSLLPSPNRASEAFSNVDAELAAIMNQSSGGNESSDHLFVIAEGTLIQLGKLAQRLASETRSLFGSSMEYKG